jgi:cytochrome c-type biogenesis protein CcmH/NrfF
MPTRTILSVKTKRLWQVGLLMVGIVFLMGSGDESARFNDIGHRLMCVCGCKQILLECNHVGCQYSDRMRGELMTALDRGDSDDLAQQAFVQKYGPAVIAAPTATGFNRVAWVMPFFVLILGIVTTVLVARTWKARAQPVSADASKEAELDRFRSQARKDTEI